MWIWIWICIYIYIYIYLYIYKCINLICILGSSIATCFLIVLRFAHFKNFQNNWKLTCSIFWKMLLKLYWQTSFLNLRLIGLICAWLRLCASKIAAVFFAPNRSQILKMFAISDFDNDPGYMLESPKSRR